MNKARITYRFDHHKDQVDRQTSLAHADSQGTSSAEGHLDEARHDRYVVHIGKDHHDMYDSQMLNQFTTDYGAWSSPFDIETERLEKLIRESSDDEELDSKHRGSDHHDHKRRSDERDEHIREHMEEIDPLDEGSIDDKRYREVRDHVDHPTGRRYDHARRSKAAHPHLAQDELVDRFGGWADDTEPRSSQTPRTYTDPLFEVEESGGPIIKEGLGTSYPSVSYRPGVTSWFRIVISVLGAIATGVLFGLFIMQMFTNLALDSEAPPVSVPQGLQQEEQHGRVEEQLPSPSHGAVAVNVPQQTVYMLQFGVFSTAEGAAAAQNQLRQAGIASAYEVTSQHIVYAGLTPDRNSAMLLSNQLANMDLETYVKPYERPVVRSLHWGEASAGQIEAYIADGASLARTVSLLTLVHLEETQLTNFEEATIEALTQSHQRWTMASNQISSHIPQAGEASFERMNNELTTAVNSLLQYRKNPSTAYLWQAQSAVMNYIILEKHLLQLLAA